MSGDFFDPGVKTEPKREQPRGLMSMLLAAAAAAGDSSHRFSRTRETRRERLERERRESLGEAGAAQEDQRVAEGIERRMAKRARIAAAREHQAANQIA